MSNPTKWFHVKDNWNNVYDYVVADNEDEAAIKFAVNAGADDVEGDDLVITEVEADKVPHKFKVEAFR